MNKVQIKVSEIDKLPELTVLDGGDPSLYDLHRVTPRTEGGTYTEDNTQLLTPKEHMKAHGTWRDREPTHENLKALIDDRNQIMKLRNKVNNQLLAFKRGTDHAEESTVDWLGQQGDLFTQALAAREAELSRFIKRMAKTEPLIKSALGVQGVGPVAIAYCFVYIDLTKARHASSVWKYAGLHTASHNRYKAGETGGGNKTLRTVLFTLADSQMKGRTRENPSAYGYIYDQVKGRLEVSEKMTKSRFSGDKGVAPREVAWKDAKPSHRHGAALRAVMKHFLADWWFVGRTLNGLTTDPGYAESQLGKNHLTIHPSKHGWVY